MISHARQWKRCEGAVFDQGIEMSFAPAGYSRCADQQSELDVLLLLRLGEIGGGYQRGLSVHHDAFRVQGTPLGGSGADSPRELAIMEYGASQS